MGNNPNDIIKRLCEEQSLEFNNILVPTIDTLANFPWYNKDIHPSPSKYPLQKCLCKSSLIQLGYSAVSVLFLWHPQTIQ